MASRSSARPDPAITPARLAAAAGTPPPLTPRQRIRVALRIAAIVAVVIPSVALHYCWRVVGKVSPWPRRFLGTVAWIVGARVVAVGSSVRGNVVFVANHISWVDILAIAGTSGSAFVAKAEIRDAPVIGWLSTLNRTVFVDREDRAGVGEQIDRLRAAIATRWSVTIFPEGTTDDGRSLLPFKSALLKILEPPPAGVVVQPIFLDYGALGAEIGWLGVEHGRDNAVRVMARAGRFPVAVHFLEPFSPATVAGRKAIAAESRRRIANKLAEVTGEPARTFVGHDAWSSGAVACKSSSACAGTAL